MERVPPVKAVMTPFPHAVDRGAPIREAREMMVRHGIRHLPVKEGDRLVGVLTDRDLKRALDPDLGLPPKDQLFVADVAVFDAYVVGMSTPLDEVLLQMAEDRIGCVLVQGDGNLAGIFTNTDACRLFGEHLKEHFRDPENDDTA